MARKTPEEKYERLMREVRELSRIRRSTRKSKTYTERHYACLVATRSGDTAEQVRTRGLKREGAAAWRFDAKARLREDRKWQNASEREMSCIYASDIVMDDLHEPYEGSRYFDGFHRWQWPRAKTSYLEHTWVRVREHEAQSAERYAADKQSTHPWCPGCDRNHSTVDSCGGR